ncbi:HAMP domain-containing sensor histidine kinase [Pseudokineococcus basanitobsidens]|uniref:histidine kinase n=1 Tax=Pseudokineococcus basanitobsidens TaxID=1926649 RepID=A0ABU8RFR5_9ACTN
MSAPGAPLARPRERLRTGSLRRRVVVAVLLLLAVLLLVLSVTVDQVLRQRLEGQLEQRLLDRAAVAVALEDQVDDEELVDRLAGQGVSVRLVTEDGEVLTAGPPLGTGTSPVAPGAARPSRDDGPGPEPPAPPAGEGVVQRGDVLSTTTELDDGALVLQADASELRSTLAQVRAVIAVSCVVALAVAALALLAVVGRVLAPLDRITATARSIGAGDRGRRLRPDRPGTELGRTAAAFDDMLDAVEGAEARARASEHRMRDLLDEAAHELRTPLAGVQAAADLLVRAERPRAEVERLAVSVVRESRRASRLVEDLLTMARIDRGLELSPQDADLVDLARTAVEDRRLRPGPAVLDVGASGPAPVRADPDRVGQVLANLLDNAVRAAGPGGRVDVLVGREVDGAVVTVLDDGPGVAPQDRERVFERLVRLDEARSRDAGGAGLGLPIARGIARAHGGDVVLRERPDGARGAAAVLRLPLRTGG